MQLNKTRSGWAGRYRVVLEHPQTQMTVAVTLVFAGLFA